MQALGAAPSEAASAAWPTSLSREKGGLSDQ